ncbi:YciI family protein [Actinomadura kijaniata]|uniref:YCII-related domain-containing protein n=1 Tax=Actinomadura namibiensis TaxID=182080 RepID=A0A7W3LM64_ACTNM|nr:YciI family protein [Actinomadura namibiensis]MBA8950597.1 hypothetical protein [Actinomadura namibiensis]
MKYMLLMQFADADADKIPPMSGWKPEEIQAHIAFMNGFCERLTASGELVEAQGLDDPSQARIVQAGPDGAPVVTDGPFPETKEFVVGYWVVDCETEGRALEIAGEASTAPGPGGEPLRMPIQIRRIMAEPPVEP